jgi:hypothetical protein
MLYRGVQIGGRSPSLHDGIGGPSPFPLAVDSAGAAAIISVVTNITNHFIATSSMNDHDFGE